MVLSVEEWKMKTVITEIIVLAKTMKNKNVWGFFFE